MKFEKYIKRILVELDENDIEYKVQGDKHTFAIAKTCTVYTKNCTIELINDYIKVNDDFVSDISELIEAVLNVEHSYITAAQ